MSTDRPLDTPITDRLVGALFSIVGLIVLWETRGLEYWSEFGPGPRFLPFWVALGMIASASYLVVKNEEHARLTRAALSATTKYAALVLLSVLSFGRLGAIATFVLLVAFELRLVEGYSFGRALLIAIAVAVVVTLIFVTGLQVSLPRLGIFGLL